MKKTYSLKQYVKKILTGFIIAVLLSGIINAFIEWKGYSQMNTVYELFQEYNEFNSEANKVKNLIMDCFFDVSLETEKKLIAEVNKMKKSADKMQELSSDKQFIDLVYLTEAYKKKTEEYVDTSIKERKELLKVLQNMDGLIQLEYKLLGEHIGDIVDFGVKANTTIWKIQSILLLVMIVWMVVWITSIGIHLKRQLVQPIELLTDRLRSFTKLEKGTQIIQEIQEKSCYKEIQILQDTYYEMAGTILRQFEELKDKIQISETLHKKELALANAELGLMQSLINPHFLYNCLSTVSSLATIEHAPRTYKSAVLIASFLRKSLDNINRKITVEEELQYTQQYIEIQKLRFADTISFFVECETECINEKIPAVILQPLIENAIRHGIKHMSQGGKICIDIKKRQSVLEVCVSDNGIGISDLDVGKIMKILQNDYQPEQKGVGLRSVVYRMRSIYGKAADIQIDSCPGNTKICLKLPCLK